MGRQKGNALRYAPRFRPLLACRSPNCKRIARETRAPCEHACTSPRTQDTLVLVYKHGAVHVHTTKLQILIGVAPSRDEQVQPAGDLNFARMLVPGDHTGTQLQTSAS